MCLYPQLQIKWLCLGRKAAGQVALWAAQSRFRWRIHSVKKQNGKICQWSQRKSYPLPYKIQSKSSPENSHEYMHFKVNFTDNRLFFTVDIGCPRGTKIFTSLSVHDKVSPFPISLTAADLRNRHRGVNHCTINATSIRLWMTRGWYLCSHWLKWIAGRRPCCSPISLLCWVQLWWDSAGCVDPLRWSSLEDYFLEWV